MGNIAHIAYHVNRLMPHQRAVPAFSPPVPGRFPAPAGNQFARRFSRCPDWTTGGLGSAASQVTGFFSSSFTRLPPFRGYYLPFFPGIYRKSSTPKGGGRNIPEIGSFIRSGSGHRRFFTIGRAQRSALLNVSLTASIRPCAKGLSSPADSRNARKLYSPVSSCS